MELIISPNSKRQINKYIKEGLMTFLFGLKDYSVHNSLYLDINDIKAIKKKYPNINIFISINKMLFNNDIESLKCILKELEVLNIKGIFFYDLALIQLKKELNLSLPLVWNQTHMVTNYKTCNYYYERGIKYALLANEITIDEILEIKKQSHLEVIVSGFGFPVVSHTKRRLLTNYFNHYKKFKTKNLYHINCGETKYIIREEKDGTTIYREVLLNITPVIDTLIDYKIPYLLINGFNIDNKKFNKIVLAFKKRLLNQLTTNELNEEINQIYQSDSNFLFKKTIYKVK